VYGAGQYDALGRLLGATYQGWTGSWSSTLAHNLTGISYDPSGNITAMRRYREDGTLIDDLTYSYPGSSNRLSSVADAVAATLGWDAQSGSFTYDANGNMTSSPAPYSVTGATYDHRNAQTTVNQSYSVGGPGTGSITLTANGTNATEFGSYQVPIIGYGVEVTPKGAAAPDREENTGGHSETFTVKNTGTASAQFTLDWDCSGGLRRSIPNPAKARATFAENHIRPHLLGNADRSTPGQDGMNAGDVSR